MKNVNASNHTGKERLHVAVGIWKLLQRMMLQRSICDIVRVVRQKWIITWLRHRKLIRMYGHHICSRVWINQARLPFLLVVS